MSPVRTASRPCGHDNLSLGKSHRGRGTGRRTACSLACGVEISRCTRASSCFACVMVNPRLAISRRSSGLLISMMSTQGPSSPAAANFNIHSTPHPRSKKRSENILHALAPPVLHQSQSRWLRTRRSTTASARPMLPSGPSVSCTTSSERWPEGTARRVGAYRYATVGSSSRKGGHCPG
jgi:hypothetical protein